MSSIIPCSQNASAGLTDAQTCQDDCAAGLYCETQTCSCRSNSNNSPTEGGNHTESQISGDSLVIWSPALAGQAVKISASGSSSVKTMVLDADGRATMTFKCTSRGNGHFFIQFPDGRTVSQPYTCP